LYVAVFVKPQTLRASRFARMLDVVTIKAKGFEIIPIKRYARVAYVLRRDVFDMVDYARRASATFAYIESARHVRRLGASPRLAAVKTFRIVLAHIKSPLMY
jgi:hypothetical protein